MTPEAHFPDALEDFYLGRPQRPLDRALSRSKRATEPAEAVSSHPGDGRWRKRALLRCAMFPVNPPTLLGDYHESISITRFARRSS